MIHFSKFYNQFLFCRDFYAELTKYPAQERCLLLLGTGLHKFDDETQLMLMNDKYGDGRNVVTISARHRPPFWNLPYTKVIADRLGGGDVVAAAQVLGEANLRLTVEFSQTMLGPSRIGYPPESFPKIAHFDPDWPAIHSMLLGVGYSVGDIAKCATNSGSIVMKDGTVLGLERAHYKLPTDRRNAVPADTYEDDITALRDIAAKG